MDCEEDFVEEKNNNFNFMENALQIIFPKTSEIVKHLIETPCAVGFRVWRNEWPKNIVFNFVNELDFIIISLSWL